MNKIKQLPLIYFVLSLIAIAILFISVIITSYRVFSKNIIDNELNNQVKMAEIVDQVLNKYLETFIYIAKNSAAQPAFNNANLANDLRYLYSQLNADEAKKAASLENIKYVLTDKRHAKEVSSSKTFLGTLSNWQLFKGLPINDWAGGSLARERRQIAKIILDTNQDIHYVFETAPNGDLIFIEPYEVQKASLSFNFAYRESLGLVRKSRQTVVSEVYISNDSKRTQSIAIAAPIFSPKRNLIGIFGLTISAATIRDQIFLTLKKKFGVDDKTLFYLIDHHGHVVASSESKYVYYPSENKDDDTMDAGNIRKLDIFKSIKWKPDRFEKNSIWERGTAIWDARFDLKIYQKKYKNLNGNDVFGTFYPINVGDNKLMWGVLIETPVEKIFSSRAYLKNVFWLAGVMLIIILILLFVIIIRNYQLSHSLILQKQEEKEAEIIMLASQVAHDIRSPLVAMEANLHILLKEFSGDKLQMMMLAVQRVRDIANNLLNQYRVRAIVPPQISRHGLIDCDVDSVRYVLMTSVIDQAVSLKQYEWQNKNVKLEYTCSHESRSKWVKVSPTIVNRVISNLLNNALEACENKIAQIQIKQSSSEEFIEIEITDNGVGIPDDKLNLYMNGASSKHIGEGLGLVTAIRYVESIAGKVAINSELNYGTSILIKFPIHQPCWFQDHIVIAENNEVIILDDDISMQSLWSHRFESYPCKLHFFTDYNSADLWLKNNLNKLEHVIMLVDYELSNESDNGLMLLKRYANNDDAYLVTSHSDEINIQNEVSKHRIKIIPKILAKDIHLVML